MQEREWKWRFAEDWRSSSSRFNTGGPVLKELLKRREEEEGSQSVGIRREAASDGGGRKGEG